MTRGSKKITLAALLFPWLALSLTALNFGGCECRRDVAAQSDIDIDLPSIIEKTPDADRPHVEFPPRLLTEDESFNKFIKHALNVCAAGDYDEFRQLFGTIHRPTSERTFEQIWHAVKEIEIKGIYPNGDKEDEYLVHTHIAYRQPDNRGRMLREAVVMGFKELDEWRIGAPPKAAITELLRTNPIVLGDGESGSEESP